jgi:hypothetical protein
MLKLINKQYSLLVYKELASVCEFGVIIEIHEIIIYPQLNHKFGFE